VRIARVVVLTTVLSLAPLPTPPASAVTLNPGDILVVDYGVDTVFQVNPTTGAQTPISSGGNFIFPSDLTVDPQGRILVADTNCCGANRPGGVIRVDPATGSQTVLSSGGSFINPSGVAVEASGKILVADNQCCGGGLGGVIRVDPVSGAQTMLASGGSFVDPEDVAVEASGQILVADAGCCGGGQGGVIRVNPTTGAQAVLSSGGSFLKPNAVALEASGQIVVADQTCCGGNGAVIRVHPSTGAQTVVAHGAPAGGIFDEPVGIAVESSGQILLADFDCCTNDDGGVLRIDPSTGSKTVVSQDGGFFNPNGVDVVPPPPPPSIQALTIDDTGIANADGAAEVSGTITCTAPETWKVALNLLQRSTGAKGRGADSGACTGSPAAWEATVSNGTGPAFAPGSVKVSAAAKLIGTSASRNATGTVALSAA
jgi:hypothetical protein